MKKIVSIGMMVADVIIKPVNKLPKRGTLDTVDSCTLATGGCALNTSIGLAQLEENVSIIGMLGNDVFASFVFSELKAKGVNTDHIVQKNDIHTSVCVVLSNADGERSFLLSPGALNEISYEDLDKDYIFSCDIVHIGAALVMPRLDGEALARFLRECKEHNCMTVVDTCWDASGKWKKNIMPLLSHIDYFAPSYEEAKEITLLENEKDNAQFFLDAGSQNVLIKMGERGVFIMNEQEQLQIPAMKIDNVLDTTGAGDSFLSGLICGIANDWGFVESSVFANATASYIVESLGANNGAATRKMVLDRLQNNGRNTEFSFDFKV